MNQSTHAENIQTSAPAAGSKIAIVSSGWHKQIVGNAVQAIKTQLLQAGIDRADLEFFEVPGAFELPLHAKLLAQTGHYRAIIACGFVVDGGIYRHEFVASAVIQGLMQVQLESATPVFSAVLTPHQFHEQKDQVDFFARHFIIKGEEVAEACLATLASLARVKGGNVRR